MPNRLNVSKMCPCGKEHFYQGKFCAKCCYDKHILAHPEKRETIARQQRVRHLLRKYGITPEKYNAMLEKQHGVCAICKAADNGRTRDGRSPLPFMVDHDHVTGKVRGLLCAACNFLVGLLEANSLRYEAAKKYLAEYKE